MKNIYFEDEEILTNDVYFICYMIERVARRLHQRNKYVVNTIGKKAWMHLISVANVLHCENPEKVENDWITDYGLVKDDFDITLVDPDLAEVIPTHLQMGKVYQRLITDTYVIARAYQNGGLFSLFPGIFVYNSIKQLTCVIYCYILFVRRRI